MSSSHLLVDSLATVRSETITIKYPTKTTLARTPANNKMKDTVQLLVHIIVIAWQRTEI